MGEDLRETDIELGLDDIAVEAPAQTLLETLDLRNWAAKAKRGVTREGFAAMLGVTSPAWWRWRTKGEAPVKVADYLHILARFPELRGKVFRHLVHRALTEVDGSDE